MGSLVDVVEVLPRDHRVGGPVGHDLGVEHLPRKVKTLLA